MGDPDEPAYGLDAIQRHLLAALALADELGESLVAALIADVETTVQSRRMGLSYQRRG